MERIAYGTDPFQFGELTLPSAGGLHPVVIVIHGGFWRAKYDLEYMRPVCESFADAGLAVWNLEYRRIGNPGGGWPGTLNDVAAGAGYVASVSDRFQLDLNRVIAIGHSAGGHLAFWLAAHKTFLTAAVSLAGVVDLRRAWELKLSNTAVADLLDGSPADVPDRYDFASPIERLSIGVPQKLFHGTIDDDVPIEISERYVQVAQLRGDDVELISLPGADHYDVVNLRTKEFALVREAVVHLSGRSKL
jgi:dipeptidyl aminopeptidase/acylaminoacyl peptidase